MAGILPSHRFLARGLPIALALCATSASAQGRLAAHYAITMTGIPVGEIAWLVDIGEKTYAIAANGKASGVLSIFINGEGAVETRGTVVSGRLVPSSFTSNITDDDGTILLNLNFADDTVTETITPEPPRRKDRLPVSGDDRRGVIDPLSAVLLPQASSSDPLAPVTCNRLLAIYDGRRRYNLVLSYARLDKFVVPPGYSGAALVCGVILEPIAGYRADSLLVKYAAHKRDMELWFVPIAGTVLVAPVRVVMPTLIGTLKIEANQFEAQAATAPHGR
jgi:hypothetical protein